MIIDEGGKVELYRCEVSQELRSALEEYASFGRARLSDVKVLETPAMPPVRFTPGQRFINRLMVLLRKEGHKEFGVYECKLRDRTPGSDEQFQAAVEYLSEQGCLCRERPMIIMTDERAAHMYLPKLVFQQGYNSHESYWQPIVDGF